MYGHFIWGIAPMSYSYRSSIIIIVSGYNFFEIAHHHVVSVLVFVSVLEVLIVTVFCVTNPDILPPLGLLCAKLTRLHNQFPIGIANDLLHPII